MKFFFLLGVTLLTQALQAQIRGVVQGADSVQTKPLKNVKITLLGAGTTVFSNEDGTFEITGGEMDGTVITVMGGIIEDVKPKVVAPVDTPLLSSEVKEQMEAKFSAQKSDLEKTIEAKFASEKADLIAETKELKENYKVVYSALDKIMNTPIDTTPDAHKKKYEEMSKREQFLFNRGKL